MEKNKDVQEIGLGNVLNKNENILRTEDIDAIPPKDARLNVNPNKEELNKLPSTTKNSK